MRRIKVTHFLQDPSYCTVGACSTVTNYYNKEMNYKCVKEVAIKKISKKIGEVGLDSGEICSLLNVLGFKKVTLVSSDLNVFDYDWSNFGKKKMKNILEESIKKKKSKEDKDTVKSVYKWYVKKGCNNIIKIDYNFGKYIRKHLNSRKPVILTFNWTMLMKFAKEGDKGADQINGAEEEHAVVANGYDKHGVWIVDSHHQYYKYKRKKYRKGFYKLPWEHLFSCMGQGDVILPEQYVNG
jgi:hypothetical protein